MTKPMVRIHNIETDEVIDRQMTDAEFAQYQIDKAKAEEVAKAEEDKAIAKATAEAKLAALGFTAEDLKALGLQHNLEGLCLDFSQWNYPTASIFVKAKSIFWLWGNKRISLRIIGITYACIVLAYVAII